MEKKSSYYRIVPLLFLILSLYSFKAFWGFQGHEIINNKAVYCLSDNLFSFYKENITYLSEHAVDPDKRRHSDKDEAPRHYIDIDHYVAAGEDPFLVMPRNWNKAVDKFSEDTLILYGIVPWHVLRMTSYLTEAFKKKDKNEILRLSAELGHYVADACVPLHSTENYDGQMTDQKGIHAFWETRLVEIYVGDFDLICDKAVYIDDQQDYIWSIVQESSSYVEIVLNAEREASLALNEDQKFIIDDKNGYESMIPSPLFSEEFNKRLDGMVEKRMRRAIEAVSSFWYTAWVNAGQPDLDDLE
jgi:hypothetical protein